MSPPSHLDVELAEIALDDAGTIVETTHKPVRRGKRERRREASARGEFSCGASGTRKTTMFVVTRHKYVPEVNAIA